MKWGVSLGVFKQQFLKDIDLWIFPCSTSSESKVFVVFCAPKTFLIAVKVGERLFS